MKAYVARCARDWAQVYNVLDRATQLNVNRPTGDVRNTLDGSGPAKPNSMSRPMRIGGLQDGRPCLMESCGPAPALFARITGDIGAGLSCMKEDSPMIHFSLPQLEPPRRLARSGRALRQERRKSATLHDTLDALCSGFATPTAPRRRCEDETDWGGGGGELPVTLYTDPRTRTTSRFGFVQAHASNRTETQHPLPEGQRFILGARDHSLGDADAAAVHLDCDK